METLTELARGVLDGDAAKVARLTEAASTPGWTCSSPC
jgi:hypothetical protein